MLNGTILYQILYAILLGLVLYQHYVFAISYLVKAIAFALNLFIWHF